MRSRKVLLILLAPLGLALLVSFKTSSKTISNPNNEHAVVIELFTSQGCSSCPSADRLLNEIVEQADQDDLPIYGLSFHVDYWNRLGWKDPYSAKEFTQRQYAYASNIKASSVYTPQMIVNGQAEFVGSNRRTAEREIELATSKPNLVDITIDEMEHSKKSLKLRYSSESKSDQKLIVNAALVTRKTSDQVTRGENRGRLLRHSNVVRKFESSWLDDTGEIHLEMDGIDLQEDHVIILYVQESESWRIVGATKVGL